MRQILISWAATSSFLILAVAALRAALGRRMGAGLRYALWGLVLVRLLVPVQLFSSPILGTTIDTEKIVVKQTITEREALDAIGGQDGPQVVATAVPVLPSPPDPPEAPDAPDWRELPTVLGWLWLAGGTVMAAVLLWCNLRFWVRLRRTRAALAADQAEEARAYTRLPVYAAQGLPSPCLFGVFRPAIYVAPETAADPVALRHVLAHEGTHFRHGDHIWSLLRCAALCVHWWNPLVWLAAKLSRRDGELACDEGALRRLGDGERTAYGNTLLVLVTAKAAPGDLLTCSTAMAGDKKSLKERFARIAKAPRRAVGIAATAVALGLLVTVCAFGQKTEASAPWEELEADLSLTIDDDGTVGITGTVDGLELPRGAFWYPDSLLSGSPTGELSLVYPPFTDGIEGQLTAWWADGSRTAVNLSTRMTAALSSYAPSGYWDFTVDFLDGGVKVTEMKAVTGTFPEGAEVRMYPKTISDEEAVRAGRIAARLLTAAEECRNDKGEKNSFVEIAFENDAPDSIFYVPDYALDAARALAEEQFRAIAPDGWVRTWGYSHDEQTGKDVPVPLKEPVEFDRVRLKRVYGPLVETLRLDGRDFKVELWQLAYEFHAVEPEQAKVLLAGGMTLDKDGWMDFEGPNYMIFTGVGGSGKVIPFRTASRFESYSFLNELVSTLHQAGLGEVEPPPYVRDTSDEISDQLVLAYQGREKPFEALWYHFSTGDIHMGTVADLNGDGRDEVVVILHEGGGTGATMSQPHIFDADTLEEYDTGWYQDGFVPFISSTGDEENFYLSAPGMNRVTIPKSGLADPSRAADAIGFGPCVSYDMQDGRLVCTLVGFAGDFEGVGELTAVVELDLDPNSMSASCNYRDFTFAPAEGFEPLPEAGRQTTAPAGARAELKAALLGETGFTFYDEEGRPADADITTAPPMAFESLSAEWEQYNSFALIDLDGDGTEEVVYHITDVAGDAGGYLVFRWAGAGDIRCYSSYWRTFWNLKTDGTFDYDYYMGRSGSARVSFPTSGYAMVQHAVLEAYYPDIDPDAGGGSFTVNGESATQEEYDAAVEAQNAKPDAAWYDFTAENVEKVLGE